MGTNLYRIAAIVIFVAGLAAVGFLAFQSHQEMLHVEAAEKIEK